MTEPIFEIVSYNKPLYPCPTNNTHAYPTLSATFASSSMGLYTQLFLKKIVAQTQHKYPHMRKLPLKKYLRRCVRVYMMTDLELLFLAYYCKADAWNIDVSTNTNANLNTNMNIGASRGHSQAGKVPNQQLNGTYNQESHIHRHLQLYLDLHSYFVKSYLGDIAELDAIEAHLLRGDGDVDGQRHQNFGHVYQAWVTNRDRQLFIITPRKINQIYREYTRNCQNESLKKDYNELVDTVIQLSTSYSIMPNRRVDRDGRGKEASRDRDRDQRNNGRNEREEEQIQEYKRNKANRMERTGKMEKKGKKNRSSGIFRISQNQQIYQGSSIPHPNSNSNVQLIEHQKPKRKSSLMFQSLQSLSRKSQQLMAESRKKDKQQQANRQLIEKLRGERDEREERQRERSRQKKPANKISLSFKRKQKPNQTVLGYIRQPSALDMHGDDRLRYNNVQKQSIRQNFSFLNLRSNRSSRSNSQLPFLWRPSQDSFFDKSKLN